MPYRCTHAEFVSAVAGELDGLAAAVAAGPAGAPVPTCPGWTIADLAGHVGQFCGFWTHILCEGTGRPKTPYPDQPQGEADLAAWIAELGASLVGELQATPSGTEVWTWYDADKSAGFVARRCAHELAIHRYDAQSARGTSGPIPTALATDGIDEMLDTLVVARARSGQANGQTMHVHGTDGDGEWLVTLHADRIVVDRQHASADLGLRGQMSDLELLLYGRPALGTVERFGDDAVLDAWYREFIF